MSLPRYPRYKDSGVGWLGQVPEHWGVRKMKWVAKMESGHTPDRKIAAYWENTDIPWISLNDTGFLKDNDYISETAYSINRLGIENSSARLLPSRVVVFSRDATIGRCAITTKPMAVSQHFIAWVCGDSMVPEYLLLRLRSMTQELDRLTTGATLKTIGMPDVRTLVTPVPPLEEQYSIVSYIDREKSKIDALMAEQRRLIELLKEKRQAVISHAVTQGLDPNVPMKDSGIEWLGKVPAHWEVKRVKSLCRLISKGTTPTTVGAEFTSHGVRFLKAENISEAGVTEQPEFFISEAAHAQLSRSSLERGDVLVVIAGATTGKAALMDERLLPANTNQAVSFLRLSEKDIATHLTSWLGIPLVRSLITLCAVQSAQPNLSMEDLGNLPVPLPPFSERTSIMSFLGQAIGDLDTLTTEAERAIELLGERRSALISAAVTGQIDVRGIAPQKAA